MMKKFAIGALALLIAFSLAACGDPDTTTNADTETDPDVTTDAGSDTESGPDAGTDTTPGSDTDTEPTDSGTDTPGTTEGDTPQTPTDGEFSFTEVRETVYVYGTSALKIRASHSLNAAELGTMQEGESLSRTGVATVKDKDGITWSRVTYYGQVGYASSDFLTTVAPLEFTAKNETVYVTSEQLNLRAKASPSAEIVVSLTKGTAVERTGVSTAKDENGNEWSRLLYNGKVCYANSTFLSATDPSPSDTFAFTTMNDTVYITAHNALNLRQEPSVSSAIVASLGYGTELARTGLAVAADADGIVWSRVQYNGKICYASNAYLSTNKTVTFTEANETLYITADSLNMRDIPSLDGAKLRALPKGTAVTCIGKATTADDEGVTWYRVVYGEATYYASAAYLSPTAP